MLVLSRGWERAAQFASEDCAGEVGTNGRFYVISASGFAPGEPAFLTITNGDMRPIEREVRKMIVGQPQLIREVVTCLLAEGHAPKDLARQIQTGRAEVSEMHVNALAVDDRGAVGRRL